MHNNFDNAKVYGDMLSNRSHDEISELSAKSFYPPEDERFYVSGIDDVEGGDCFYDYSESFWDDYEDLIFDCNN